MEYFVENIAALDKLLEVFGGLGLWLWRLPLYLVDRILWSKALQGKRSLVRILIKTLHELGTTGHPSDRERTWATAAWVHRLLLALGGALLTSFFQS